MIKVSKLKKNPNNPRILRDDKFEKLKNSIREFPRMMSLRPIIVDADNIVLGGNMRLEAIKSLGMKEIPDEWVKRADDLTDAQKQEFIVKDNVGFGEWDWDALGNSFDELPLSDWGLDVPNFEIVEDAPEEDENAVAETISKAKELQAKWGTAENQLWKLGEHRLLCGDSTKREDVERLMNGEIAEMMFTDPPYGVNYSGGIQFNGDGTAETNNREKLENDDSAQIYLDFLPVVLPFVDGACYMWFADRKGYEPFVALKTLNCELHAVIIWHKINATYAAMNAQYKQRHEPCLYFKPKSSTLRWCGESTEATLWEIKRDSVNEFHPTQKPIELAEKAIGNHTAKTVADFFAGSGSTLIACEKLKRKCFAMEFSPEYVAVTLERWANLTSKTPELIDG